jgi:hypothetical protein
MSSGSLEGTGSAAIKQASPGQTRDRRGRPWKRPPTGAAQRRSQRLWRAPTDRPRGKGRCRPGAEPTPNSRCSPGDHGHRLTPLHHLEAGDDRDIGASQLIVETDALDLPPVVRDDPPPIGPSQAGDEPSGGLLQRGLERPRRCSDLRRHNLSFRGAGVARGNHDFGLADSCAHANAMRSRGVIASQIPDLRCVQFNDGEPSGLPGTEPGGSEINAKKAPSRTASLV